MTDIIRTPKNERLTVRTGGDIKASIRDIMRSEGRTESDVVNRLLAEAIGARSFAR